MRNLTLDCLPEWEDDALTRQPTLRAQAQDMPWMARRGFVSKIVIGAPGMVAEPV